MRVEGTAGPSAAPDFLLVLVALASSMRLSLMKAAHGVATNGASEGNPGTLGMTKFRVTFHHGVGGDGSREPKRQLLYTDSTGRMRMGWRFQ
jgi:hypothetical protein